MKKMILGLGLVALLVGCSSEHATSDEKQRNMQERILAEGTAKTGMPAIKNFRERKMLKMILELRDQEGYTTYTYLYSEMTGKLIYFGETIGYGIPYATQYTAPEKPLYANTSYGFAVPQADPNGLFTPVSAEGTWVLLKDPNGKDVKPVYIEPRIVVSPFRLKGASSMAANPLQVVDIDRTEAEALAEELVELRSQQCTVSREASGIGKQIKEKLSTLCELMLRLGIHELLSADGKTTFSLDAKAKKTPQSQPKLGSQFRDVAEAVDGAQGMINGCARLNGLHNGLAVEFLTELANGFGAQSMIRGVDHHINEMNLGEKHADSLARIRQLVANDAHKGSGKGKKNGRA